MAAVEHLPQALGLALADATMHEPTWREMGKLAGGGFERITALMGEDPDGLGRLLLANQDNLVRWLGAYVASLSAVRDLVASGEHELLAQFIDRAVVARQQWLQDRRDKFAEIKPPELERTSLLRHMFIGGRRSRS